MATSAYITGRKKYGRPQAVLLSNNPGILDSGLFVPDGTEWTDFIFLTDHNRQEIAITSERIETKRRMINGTMRSYHVADKASISLSWQHVPSRAYSVSPTYSENGRTPAQPNTVDGGAGGVEMLKWYEEHTGSFYVFLAYDKYTNFSSNPYQHLHQYNVVHEVFFNGDFSHTITKRGQSNFDLWDVRFTLVEA